MLIEIKTCLGCKKELPVTEFYKHSQGGPRSRCKPCYRLEVALYYKKNKDKKAVTNAAYYENNKDKIVVTQATYYENNRDKIAVFQAAYRKKNKDKSLLRIAEYRKNNPEKVKASCKTWRKANPGKLRINSAKRRSRKKLAPGTFSEQDVQSLYQAQQGCCEYCSADLAKTGYEIDHMIPLSRTELSPTNEINNLCLACISCNRSKGKRTTGEFKRAQTRKL